VIVDDRGKVAPHVGISPSGSCTRRISWRFICIVSFDWRRSSRAREFGRGDVVFCTVAESSRGVNAARRSAGRTASRYSSATPRAPSPRRALRCE
jgi:hypothetical protein